MTPRKENEEKAKKKREKGSQYRPSSVPVGPQIIEAMWVSDDDESEEDEEDEDDEEDVEDDEEDMEDTVRTGGHLGGRPMYNPLRHNILDQGIHPHLPVTRQWLSQGVLPSPPPTVRVPVDPSTVRAYFSWC
ncbi:OLC1v1018682C1 [Oldenlandia corymbosa var. corymbosa]|uniref:OLC1v1018682C1 n=1 Tax=Oldenlandia corymbosa var. corymbosa TaxID=529605 RepID=A0AAV1EC61_OLDCO|nr:OLC1v1018682C1 [Oldenlandia corymbosa var. corymbosa]